MSAPHEKLAYMSATPMQREVVVMNLNRVLAILSAQVASYQASHWQVRGYQNHDLFGRLYGSVQGPIDVLAEKTISYFGAPSVDLGIQTRMVAQLCGEWAQISDHVERGLHSETVLQEAIKAAYDGIKESGAMTLGLDDFLMSTASTQEVNIYLLQQAQEGNALPLMEKAADLDFAPKPAAPSAEGEFFDNPEKREVREFAESDALSNDPEVAAEASVEDQLDLSERDEVDKAEDSPPTPTEIAEEPGGAEVSTLNRYVVTSEEPGVEPSNHMAAWLREVNS
jgi:DNA-binding ferritin-like protein